jgi:hypothetical protein
MPPDEPGRPSPLDSETRSTDRSTLAFGGCALDAFGQSSGGRPHDADAIEFSPPLIVDA